MDSNMQSDCIINKAAGSALTVDQRTGDSRELWRRPRLLPRERLLGLSRHQPSAVTFTN